MEQTLGKRIAENRKRLKLTQDALAEQLGITAQAVSKWENDQSCPDITILPKLAGIFGITTDELLGRDTPKTVHEAEVVDDAKDAPGIHFEMADSGKDKWEFHWDSGKKGAVTFAVLVLWVGGLTLASRLLHWEASLWEILWPSALLIYGARGLLKGFSLFSMGVALCGLYFLNDNLDIYRLNIGGELIIPILIVVAGVGLLIDALRKPKKPKFTVTRNGGNSGKTRCSCATDGDRFCCDLSFGENTHTVSVAELAGGEASVSFGELQIDLTGCQAVRQNCTIDVRCTFGELELRVPRRFRVEPSSSTIFAEILFDGQADPEPAGILSLNASVRFGEITVKYI